MSHAFKPPFYTGGSSDYTIPEKYEEKLLDTYTQIQEVSNEEEFDLQFTNIHDAIQMLGVPPEVIVGLKKGEWCIDSTNIVDFDKWLYMGFFWLILGQNYEIVDSVWFQLTNSTNRKGSIKFNKLDTMIRDLKLDLDVKSMFDLASNNKNFINYIDLFTILGRLGFIPL